MRKANIIVASTLLALSIFIIYQAKKLPASIPGAGLGPGVVPFWLALCLAFLSALLLIINILNLDKYASGQISLNRQELISVGVIFLTLILYMIFMEYLGFGIATIFLVTFLSKRLGNYALWKCSLLGIVVAVVSVQVFRNFLSMPLPTGFLGF
ncbi:MAG: hypothetical protein JG781_786 [Peptococcaceae bacterium]|nr:hypothetical protein [Peptococcaceae bacterium]